MSKEDNPDYQVLVPVCKSGEPWFEFDADIRGKTSLPVLSPYRAAQPAKDMPAHERASGCDSILAVHEDAIVVGAPAGTSDAFAMLVVFSVLFLSRQLG